jgi:GABA(A) receptor-associated protein
MDKKAKKYTKEISSSPSVGSISSFKKNFSLDIRKKESRRIRAKFPDRIPIILQKRKGCHLKNIEKNKYLVPNDITMGQFLYIIRKNINLSTDESIFVFCNNKLPMSSALISQIYREEKEEDDFLYLEYSGEQTFGSTFCS